MSTDRVKYFAGSGHDAIRPSFPAEAWDPFYPFPAVQVDAEARFDWRETVEAHVLTVRMPVMRKEEVKVEVEAGGMLKISGERRVEKEEKGDTWRREERRSEMFLRRFRLPENSRVAEVTAAMEKDGVLIVTVPKMAEVKVIPVM